MHLGACVRVCECVCVSEREREGGEQVSVFAFSGIGKIGNLFVYLNEELFPI